MNLVGEEIRLRQVRTLAAIPRSTRQYLEAIYGEMARRLPQDRDLRRYPTLVQDQFIAPQRYRGRWTDGTTATGDTVAPWNETRSSPTLAGRPCSTSESDPLARRRSPWPKRPRPGSSWSAAIACRAGCWAIRAARRPRSIVAAAPLVAATFLRMAGRSGGSPVRVTTNWVRRIVWIVPRPKPSTLFYPDGREVSFRACLRETRSSSATWIRGPLAGRRANLPAGRLEAYFGG